jgi:hypothetical protein
MNHARLIWLLMIVINVIIPLDGDQAHHNSQLLHLAPSRTRLYYWHEPS